MAQPPVLITGITGFLGSNLARSLVKSGVTVVGLKRTTSDLRRIADFQDHLILFDLDTAHWTQAFDTKPQVVFHCATNYGRRETPPTEIIEANLTLPLRLLQMAEQAGVTAFINSDTILDKRINHYSLSKAQFVEWLEVHSTRLRCINMELEHFYGPRDDSSKFVTSILHKLISGEPAIDLTPGQQKRDFVYIDDVVAAYQTVLKNLGTLPLGLHRFQVGSGTSVKIKEFVELAARLTANSRTKLNFGALPYRTNEAMDSRADIRALQKLGWVPVHSLEDGLAITIQSERSRR